MKKFNYIVVIIAILNIVIALFCFNKEGYIINVNSSNKEIVKNALNGKINNVDNINKIILGQGWNSGELTIYHSSGKTETLNISEGMYKLGTLETYIRENGTNLDKIGFVLIGISSLIIMYLLIYRYVNKNKL